MPLLYGGRYRGRPGGGGYGTGYGEAFEEYKSAPVPSLDELQQKYLGQLDEPDIPRDPEKIYEGIMGPARTDVQGAQEKIGLGLQKHATGGASYEDMLARYLPGATEQMADIASKAGVASTEFAQKGEVAQTQAEIARQRVANDMAIADKQIQEDSRRFMLDMKARIEMADREIRAKERIALQQARTAEHVARIRANADTERARIAANAQMETTKYAQAQENYRNNVRMQVYDKWYTGQLALGERRENRLGVESAARFPNVPREGRTGVSTTGKPLPDPWRTPDTTNLTQHEARMGKGVGYNYPAGTQFYGPAAGSRDPQQAARDRRFQSELRNMYDRRKYYPNQPDYGYWD